jgi:hypothetical protein
LKPGIHVFDYRVDDKFFLAFGEKDFSNCVADIKLTLDKNSNFIQLKFDIGGQADVSCDRCGNTLSKQLWEEFTIIVKILMIQIKKMQRKKIPIYFILAAVKVFYTLQIGYMNLLA